MRNNVKVALPGLGTAMAIFGTYIFLEAFYEQAYAKKPKHISAVKELHPSEGAH